MVQPHDVDALSLGSHAVHDHGEEVAHALRQHLTQLVVQRKHFFVAGFAQTADRMLPCRPLKVCDFDLHTVFEKVHREYLSLTILIQVLLHEAQNEDWADRQEDPNEASVGYAQFVQGQSG